MAFTLTLIADTAERFSDFAPYVASLNNRGVVAFQAALRAGGTGIFSGDGGSLVAAAESSAGAVESSAGAAESSAGAVESSAGAVESSAGAARSFRSHPDINDRGELSVYCDLAAGGEALSLFRDGGWLDLADTRGPFARIGPLGPTMNDDGVVAFRAEKRSGGSGIFLRRAGVATVTIAESGAGGAFSGFHGLPVVNRHGAVAFRADLAQGGQAIYASNGGAFTGSALTTSGLAASALPATGALAASALPASGILPASDTLTKIAETGPLFSALGSFPSINDSGTVAFSATLRAGGSGIFTASRGKVTMVADTNGPFESLRGALIGNASGLLFATPRGGKLAVYATPAALPAKDMLPAKDLLAAKLLALGDPLYGSVVTDFALNPVSLNDAGQVAIRVTLADDRQLVLRADPA